MEEKEIVEKIFKENGIDWEVKNFGRFIDPKCKTASSIYDKLLRLYATGEKRENYTILNSNIDDLLRMTIVTEYKDAVNIINKLKSSFSDLTGYLQIEKAGYRGIHLNLKIDGVPCEIQLAPKLVVMAIDYLHTLYEKWRSFSVEVDINKNLGKREMVQERLISQEKVQEEKKDFALRNKVYGEIYKIAEFDKHKLNISLVLENLNKTKQESSSLKDAKLIEILNQDLLKEGKLDKEKIKSITMLLSKYLQPVQEKFVGLVKTSLN